MLRTLPLVMAIAACSSSPRFGDQLLVTTVMWPKVTYALHGSGNALTVDVSIQNTTNDRIFLLKDTIGLGAEPSNILRLDPAAGDLSPRVSDIDVEWPQRLRALSEDASRFVFSPGDTIHMTFPVSDADRTRVQFQNCLRVSMLFDGFSEDGALRYVYADEPRKVCLQHD